VSRTSTGLIRVGNRLAGPPAGLFLAVDPGVRRPAKTAFERLGDTHLDLTVLEKALDRLAGTDTTPTERSVARSAGHGRRSGDGTRPYIERSTAPNTLPPGRAVESGETRSRPADEQAAELAPGHPERSHGPDGPTPTGDVAAGGSAVSPSGPADRGDDEATIAGLQAAAFPAAEAEEQTRPSSAAAPGPSRTGDESPIPAIVSVVPEHQIDAQRAPGSTLPSPGTAVASSTGLGGALGDLVRHSTNAVAAAETAATLAAQRPGQTPQPMPPGRHPVQTPRHAAVDTTDELGAAVPATVIAAFEAALDHVVHREAERHGLEGLL